MAISQAELLVKMREAYATERTCYGSFVSLAELKNQEEQAAIEQREKQAKQTTQTRVRK